MKQQPNERQVEHIEDQPVMVPPESIQSLPPIPTVPVFNPATAPIRGMSSYPHPSGLQQGQASLMQNLRVDDSTLRCRDGIAEITGISGIPSGTGIFRGATFWNGAFYAGYVSGTRQVRNNAGVVEATVPVIDVYKSTNLTSWVRITSDTVGKHGVKSSGPNAGKNLEPGPDNRLEDYGSMLSFTPVSSNPFRTGEEGNKRLLVSNGSHPTDSSRTNFVRVLNGESPLSAPFSQSYQSHARVALHRSDVDPPSLQSSLRSIVTFPTFGIIHSTGGVTFVHPIPARFDATGSFRCGTQGIDPNRWVRLYIDTGTLNNDTAGFNVANWGNPFGDPLSSSASLGRCKQLILVTQVSEPGIWDNIRVDVLDAAGNFATVYDPSDPKYDKVEITFETSGTPGRIDTSPRTTPGSLFVRRRASIPGRNPGDISLVALNIETVDSLPLSPNAIRFVWKGATVASDMYLDVLAVAGSGQWQGLGQFGVSLMDIDGRAESRGVVIPLGGGDMIRNIGGPQDETSSFPESPDVYYTPSVPIQSCTIEERDRGVNISSLYRREYGASDYYAVSGAAFTFAFKTIPEDVPSNTWQWNSPWTGPDQVRYQFITWNAGVDATRKMPDFLHKGLNPFTCGRVASNRLFAGNLDKVQISEAGNPYRHREVVRFDDNGVDLTSPSERQFSGETIVNIESVAASIYGADQAILWTDSRSYSLDGGDPRSGVSTVGVLGMAARDSLASYKGSMWWLDDQRQIRLFADGSSAEPSRGTVEDWLQSPATSWDGSTRGIPVSRVNRVACAWHRDRLYIAFTPSGGTRNSRVLVYSTRTDSWSVDSAPPAFSCEQWIVWDDSASGRKRLIAFGDDGRIFEYETPSQLRDFGSLIPVALWTREYHENMWEPLRVLRTGIVCDSLTGGSMTMTRKFRSGSPDSSSVLSIEQTGGVWRWTNMEGGRGVGCRLEVSANVEAGWRIYSIVAEAESAGGSGASV